MNQSSRSDGYFFSVVFCAWLLQTRPSTVILGRPQKVPTVIRGGTWLKERLWYHDTARAGAGCLRLT